jgi:hypothetical protein
LNVTDQSDSYFVVLSDNRDVGDKQYRITVQQDGIRQPGCRSQRPNGLKLGCPAEAGNPSLLYGTPAGETSTPEGPARRVSFSELLGAVFSNAIMNDPRDVISVALAERHPHDDKEHGKHRETKSD